MSNLKRPWPLFVVLLIALVVSVANAKEYIEVWPEGWSEIVPLFPTGTFADRFAVVHDQLGTGFLNIDGLYFRELDLTYRLLRDGKIEEEIVISQKRELEDPYLGLDDEGNRHILWLEKSPQKNTINYLAFSGSYAGEQPVVVLETKNTIQNLSALQVGVTTHLAWSEWENGFQIRYAQLERSKLKVLETVTTSAEISIRPSVTVDQSGSVHLAWMDSGLHGVVIFYSRRGATGWLKPIKVGNGSVQDVEQGGNIAIKATDGAVFLVWAALPRTSSSLHIHFSQIPGDLQASAPEVLAAGNKPRFVVGSTQLQLVWQGMGGFGAQINYGFLQNGRLNDLTNLTVGRKGAFRPEAISRDDFLWVYWLQTGSERTFMVHGINNEHPKVISIWRRIGIDEQAPAIHLAFLVLSTFMLAVVYTIANSGVLLVGGIFYGLVYKIGRFRRQTLLYKIAFGATVLMVTRHLPVPTLQPRFFGWLHHWLSFTLAICGTCLILRKVRQSGLFINISMLILWMMLFQFFSLIPQTILQ